MDWTTTKVNDPNDALAYPVDYFSLSCLECNNSTKNICNEVGGKCERRDYGFGYVYNECICNEGFFGERCEYVEEDICDELGFDSRFEPFNPDFPESFRLIQRIIEEGLIDEFYNKAVYSYEDMTTNEFYLIAYFGRRYYILNGDFDTLRTIIGLEDDEFLDLDVMYYFFLWRLFEGFDYEGSGINPIYVSEPINLYTAKDKPTPADLSWYFTDARLTPGPPVSTRLVCV